MSIIKHQNNFATNLTSNQTSGVTTTPLNSIPSIAAPFYIALDATNLNSKYEVVYVTSKTATHINHAATTYAHTTAEEVRNILPAAEIDTFVVTPGTDNVLALNAPQGFLINGKIVPSVTSSNLTVAIKTLAGTDPSATNPVYVRIGDTVRTITAALSVTKNAATNWFNSGSAELATKEVDYFAYLGYNATDGVVIGFARIPYATSYGDFSTTANLAKYAAISTITNAASTDNYELVGRFAATLSATAAFTWSVPTFTAINLIQRPIYETRLLEWVTTWTGYSVAPTGTYRYRVVGNQLRLYQYNQISGTSNATTNKFTIPFLPTVAGGDTRVNYGWGVDNGSNQGDTPRLDLDTTGTLTYQKSGLGVAWTGSGTKNIGFNGLTIEI